ncbi:hypothetical protein QBC47DRAFT_432849 [Echria macrotheca]|uniref:Uncharacterized protein n=1 Tax=Echria macrotheca TaxID=438768 RepID=A0AAJ0B7U4_9PEZI|nr:hypothetical protein QBC47DRAFT_432849 [Echria macrotheca]
MKFAPIIAFATGIAALPWSLTTNKKHEVVKVTGDHGDFTVHVHVSQEPRKTHGSHIGPGICLKVCWPESPTCPEGWVSHNFGDEEGPCWTCCKKEDEDL